MERPKGKGGRPHKEDKDKRDNLVVVRLTTKELQRLKERMAQTKAPDLSTFIRAACLENRLVLALPSRSDDDKILSLLREIRADLLKIGANINQSTKRINSTTDYHDLQKESTKMSEQMLEMEAQFNVLMRDFITNPR